MTTDRASVGAEIAAGGGRHPAFREAWVGITALTTVGLQLPFHRGRGGDDGPAAEAPKGISGRVLKAALERALRVQHPRVAAHIAKIRRNKPDASPAETIAALDRRYLAAVAGIGAAGGGAAVVPGLGIVASLATGAAEAIAALDASVLYTLAVAEVHGVPIQDVDRRRALVLGIILGGGASRLLSKATGGSKHWAKDVANTLPLSKLGPVNQTLVRWLVKRYVVRQGALAFGRALPLGIGAAVGAAGNLAVARGVIRSARQAFGPPPPRWPEPARP